MRVGPAQQGASTTVDKGKAGRGIDERAFKRMKEFDGNEVEWKDWAFQFQAAMRSTNRGVDKWMRWVQAKDGETISEDELNSENVDDDIDARDWKDVMWAISTRMDPVRDVTLIENTPIDYLDFASPESGLGGKIGLDATNKWPPETKREWGRQIRMDEDVIETVTKKWSKLGLPGTGKPIWK